MGNLLFEELVKSTDYFFAHESHESSRNVFNEINGDLIGRTNHTNNMIELVKIRATVQVAIITESNEFV